jgi:GxxExxY protein
MLNAELTQTVIGAAIEVRNRLGCGLLESAYHTCFCIELAKRGLEFESQPPLPIVYDDHRIPAAYRPDLIIAKSLIVELKTVTDFSPAHKAQILTYLRLSAIRVGLLINFHAVPFSKGIKRFVM